MRLAGEAGTLVADFSAGRINRNPDLLSAHMSSIFRALSDAATGAHVSSKRPTNTPVRAIVSVLKCADDRKNRVVSAQATYTSGNSAVGV
jgi:hypothetical protein